MTIFIKAELNDLSTLEKLAQEIWREYSICFITKEQIEYMLDKFQSQKAMISQLQNGYEYYFIKENNQNAGYFAIQPQTNKLFLSKIYISKNFRNKGLGRKSLEFIKQKAKECQLNTIELTVNKTNENSIKAYQNWGFKIKSSDITDIGNGFVMDDFILEYEL